MASILSEGIDIDPFKREVSFNPKHEKGVNGLTGNPTQKELNLLNKLFKEMIKDNDYFSYRKIPPNLRKFIDTSSVIDANDALKYSDMINDKDVLILDDTISSGETISDNVQVLMKTFEPKSVQVITLFGPLK